MQKRNMNKRMYPGKWSITGGAVDVGENSVEGVCRECKEEIGIDLNLDKLELMMTIKRKHVFVDVYLYKDEVDINNLNLQEEEVDEVKWFTRNDVMNLIKEKNTSNSVMLYFEFLCKLIDEGNK